MKINFLKTLVIVLLSIVIAIYLLFLILPYIISPIVNKYLPTINSEIKKATGLESNIKGFRIVTTPKLTIGAQVEEFSILTPDFKEVFEAENFVVKMSLIPLLTKKIEIDLVKVDDINIKLGLNKDGSFEIEKHLPKQTQNPPVQTEKNSETISPMELPLGLRLSNKLPDIKIGNYDIELIEIPSGKKYEIEGNKTELTNFVLDKHVKILATGAAKFEEREQFAYKLKINNHIMPNLSLHDMIFSPIETPQKESPQQPIKINILNILKGIHNNKITANLDTDLTITPNGNNGYIKANNISILDLPKSNITLDFKSHKTNIDSNIYTAQNEISTIKGFIQGGKNPTIDINLKSKVELNNIFKILNAAAMTFDIKDLQTLKANGSYDADLNIKSNLKTVKSNGYFKIPNANIQYNLYNINIDDINANVILTNNNIDIKNIGFSIFNQPLKFYGLIKEDASMDLHLLAEKLNLKGLLIACGQSVLLKENPVNSGTITLKADIIGKLNNIKPTAKISLNNIDIKNTPSNTTIKLPNTNIDINSDGKTFSGIATSENIKIINPAANVIVPKINANIKEDTIEITQTLVQIEKINFNLAGKIKNYLTPKIYLDFVTNGDIKSTLQGDVNLVKQTLNLNFAAPQNSTIVVPMFDKSKLTFNGNISITGNMINPILKGDVNVPEINIPEIPVKIDNLIAKLSGPILKGHASLTQFATGGIIARDCTSDFLLKGNDFYLKNIKGTAFDGKINGDIVYNLSNFNTSVDFHGSNLNAEKAIAGAVGIKNALSGMLNFDTKLTLKVVDYEDMIRSMKGNLKFKVANGSFGNIGRLENFFNANNIVSNAILKTTVATISNLAPIKESAKFEYITGDMNFSNGWANLTSIKSSGQTLAYFVYGKFNLINMTTNVTILGRLDSSLVALLGPIGELSAEKVLSFIPKFGNLTANIINIMTANPKGEKISEIPQLANGNNIYKDFKVSFNGGLESTSSIKSFKWLTDVDTSAIEKQSITDTIKSIKTSVDEDLTNTVQGVVDTVKSQKDALKSTANELKNLFKF